LVYSLTALLVGVDEGGTGAGAISCLMFGLILGNGRKILKMIKYEGRNYEMDEQTKQFHSLTSFIIRTFFFVYLGIMVSFQRIEFIIVGIIVLLALLGLRYVAVYFTTYKGGFEKDDKQTMNVMMPRGLAAAILAISFGPVLVSKEGLDLGASMQGFFEDVAFVVILGTAIITTIGVSIISHYEMKKMKASETQKNESNSVENIEEPENQ
jgi:cell volume regulation protein A